MKNIIILVINLLKNINWSKLKDLLDVIHSSIKNYKEMAKSNKPKQSTKPAASTPAVPSVPVKSEPEVKAQPTVTNTPDIVVTRKWFTDKSTIGELTIDGKFICFTLEDRDRKLESGGTKVMHETAIPRGTYEVIINRSVRFQRMLPLLLNVPQFTGIRIHTGNWATNSSGCLCLGFRRGEDEILESRPALRMFIEILAEKLKKGKVYIQIK